MPDEVNHLDDVDGRGGNQLSANYCPPNPALARLFARLFGLAHVELASIRPRA
jgi:hypothetical protein